MNKKILMLFVLFSLFVTITGCSHSKIVSTQNPPAELSSTYNPEVWGKSYPLEYASYLKNNTGGMTNYGGSDRVSKFETEPEIKELFKGYGFSIEYNEDRGHTYALTDIKEIAPERKAAGTCITCKTPHFQDIYKEMGNNYYVADLNDLIAKSEYSIACADCHDPSTMDLRITRPAFREAMSRQGIDIDQASHQEMRSYVCGQCHVEYYFQKDTKKLTFPWDNGFGPEESELYYDNLADFKDWQHPDSQTNMRKVQHPEFETWSTGPHGSAGVACTDCHMPYMREERQKYSSHWWTSPLKTVEISCTNCHDQSQQWLEEQVQTIQQRTFALQSTAGKAIAEAHAALREAIEKGSLPKENIQRAQRLIVEAQWRWDWVAAENSRGFHNPTQALYSLGQALDKVYQIEKLLK